MIEIQNIDEYIYNWNCIGADVLKGLQKGKNMNKIVRLNEEVLVTIVSADNANATISPNEAEMDMRAREAVKSAIKRAETCKKPIAKYDKENKKAYIETAGGEKIYV